MTTDIRESNSSLADNGRTQAPPAAATAFDLREAWCLNYVEQVIARSPTEGSPPADMRPSQRFEDEFNSCKLDPQEYELQTRTL